METPPSTKLEKALAEAITPAEHKLTMFARSKGYIRPDEEINLHIVVAQGATTGGIAAASPDILDEDVDILGLTKKSRNLLSNQGVNTMRTLITKDPVEIARGRGCGKKFFYEVTEALRRQGLAFEHPLPKHLIWTPGPSPYQVTLDNAVVDTLTNEHWRQIEEVPWKRYQKDIMTAIRIIANRPITGKRMFRYTDQRIHVGTIVRCINDQFVRAQLPFRLKATINIDHEDRKKSSWGFQICILPK